MNRRQFIGQASKGLAVGAVGLPLLLEACAPAPAGSGATARPDATGSGPYDSAKPAAAGVMPTYIAFPQKPTADFPSQGEPYMDAFLNFPRASMFKSMPAKPPGTGGVVNAMTIGLFPPPTPFENNPAWQEINKQLNADVKMNIVAPGDYLANWRRSWPVATCPTCCSSTTTCEQR